VSGVRVGAVARATPITCAVVTNNESVTRRIARFPIDFSGAQDTPIFLIGANLQLTGVGETRARAGGVAERGL